MCGRMAITLPHEAMAQVFGAVPANDLPEVPDYNVCPTVNVHTVVSAEGGRLLRPMRWGLLPPWYKTPTDGPLLINARAETIVEKPAFRTAAKERRCIVPASGFYEWTKDAAGTRYPWYITRSDGRPLAFAAIWQVWDRGDSQLTTVAIVTTAANDSMSRIHHRMPVVLEEADWPLWLGEAGHGAAVLMRAAPEEALVFHRVGREVNSNRARGAGLIAPVEV
ncbi:SOS response-associated peptidase [Histidinibacterium lentulum]|uniref:Abasic site processing protein n=1 Tax=Histidinibacterium lentulum TaxID=2480588 RepID=A0A3N2QWD6_9RHOB|nr:SOS response-associated peptidase [Histidinibacterium lentulum]ROT99482.1 SOS response-associated peptidase [Histidinibacterium lentulum]